MVTLTHAASQFRPIYMSWVDRAERACHTLTAQEEPLMRGRLECALKLNACVALRQLLPADRPWYPVSGLMASGVLGSGTLTAAARATPPRAALWLAIRALSGPWPTPCNQAEQPQKSLWAQGFLPAAAEGLLRAHLGCAAKNHTLLAHASRSAAALCSWLAVGARCIGDMLYALYALPVALGVFALGLAVDGFTVVWHGSGRKKSRHEHYLFQPQRPMSPERHYFGHVAQDGTARFATVGEFAPFDSAPHEVPDDFDVTHHPKSMKILEVMQGEAEARAARLDAEIKILQRISEEANRDAAMQLVMNAHFDGGRYLNHVRALLQLADNANTRQLFNNRPNISRSWLAVVRRTELVWQERRARPTTDAKAQRAFESDAQRNYYLYRLRTLLRLEGRTDNRLACVSQAMMQSIEPSAFEVIRIKASLAEFARYAQYYKARMAAASAGQRKLSKNYTRVKKLLIEFAQCTQCRPNLVQDLFTQLAASKDNQMMRNIVEVHTDLNAGLDEDSTQQVRALWDVLQEPCKVRHAIDAKQKSKWMQLRVHPNMLPQCDRWRGHKSSAPSGLADEFVAVTAWSNALSALVTDLDKAREPKKA